MDISVRGAKRFNPVILEIKFEAICARKTAETLLGYDENHGRS